MSQALGIWDDTYIAEADLRNYQYRVVAVGASARGCVPGTTANVPIGVLQNAPNIGEAAIVRKLGSSKVYADGAFAYGDYLAVADANGEVDTAGAAPCHIVGRAEEAAGKAHVYVEMTVLTAYLAASVAPAALTDACTESQMMEYHTSGDVVATVTAKVIGIARGAGVIDKAGFRVGNTGTDASNPLSLEGDVLINGTTIFSTKPVIAKTAADGANSFASGTGVTVGVINAAANIVAANDIITAVLTLTRTASPSDEMDTVDLFAFLTNKVGA